jgi:hypothetical protein
MTSNNRINITLINCTNPFSVKPTSNIIITITRSGLNVQSGVINYQATVGTLNFTLKPTITSTNSSSTCYLSINTFSIVPTNSYIYLVYPYTTVPLLITNPTISLCVLNSMSVSNCAYSLVSSTLNFINIFQSNFSAGTILLNFSQFTNPPSILQN